MDYFPKRPTRQEEEGECVLAEDEYATPYAENVVPSESGSVSPDTTTGGTTTQKKYLNPGEDGLIEIKVHQDANDKINIVLDANDLVEDKERYEEAMKRIEHYNKAKLKNRFAIVLIDKLTSEIAALKEEVEYLREDSKQKSKVIQSLTKKILEQTESEDKWHFEVVKQVEQNTQHPLPPEERVKIGCCDAFAMCLVDSMEEPEELEGYDSLIGTRTEYNMCINKYIAALKRMGYWETVVSLSKFFVHLIVVLITLFIGATVFASIEDPPPDPQDLTITPDEYFSILPNMNLKNLGNFTDNKASFWAQIRYKYTLSVPTQDQDDIMGDMKAFIADETGRDERLAYMEEIQNRAFIVMKWFYFLTIASTTIGYGDVSPGTQHGRLFYLLFSIVAVGLVMTLLGRCGFLITKLNNKLFAFIKSRFMKNNEEEGSEQKISEELLSFFSIIALFFLFLLIGWWHRKTIKDTPCTVIDFIYYWIVTFTTVGFGDLYLFTLEEEIVNIYILFVYRLIGLSFVSGIIASLTVYIALKEKQFRERARLIAETRMALLDRKISIEKNATLYPEYAIDRVDRDVSTLERQKSDPTGNSGDRRASLPKVSSSNYPIYDLDSRSTTLEKQRSDSKSHPNHPIEPKTHTDYPIERQSDPTPHSNFPIERQPSILKKQKEDTTSQQNYPIDRQPSILKRQKYDSASYPSYENDRRPSIHTRTEYIERGESNAHPAVIERQPSILKKQRDECSVDAYTNYNLERQPSILKKQKDDSVPYPSYSNDRKASTHSKLELPKPNIAIDRQPSVTIREADATGAYQTYASDKKVSTGGEIHPPSGAERHPSILKKQVKDGSTTYLNYDASRPTNSIERKKNGSTTYINYDTERKSNPKANSTTYINYDSDRKTSWTEKKSRADSATYLNYDSDWSQMNTLERQKKRYNDDGYKR